MLQSAFPHEVPKEIFRLHKFHWSADKTFNFKIVLVSFDPYYAPKNSIRSIPKKWLKVLLAYPPKWQIINQIQANNPKSGQILQQIKSTYPKSGPEFFIEFSEDVLPSFHQTHSWNLFNLFSILIFLFNFV